MLAIIGMFMLLRTLLRSHWAGIIGAWAFSFSPSLFYHGINPMPDVLALCAAIWGLSLLFKWRHDGGVKYMLMSALLLGVATAIKLPFVFMYLVPAVVLIQDLVRPTNVSSKNRLIGSGFLYLLLLIPAAIWYIKVIPTWHGSGIVTGLVNSQDSSSELMHYLVHNVVSTLPELLLNWGAVILFVFGLVLVFLKGGKRNTNFWPLLVLGVGIAAYYLFELNMIQDKHDYYAYPFMPLLFIAVGIGIRFILSKSKGLKLLLYVCIIAMPVLATVRKGNGWNQENPGINRDLIHLKKELQSAVPDEALCVVGNDRSGFIYFYHLDKKGWNFYDDALTIDQLKEMKSKGAEYLYSNSDGVNQMVEQELNLVKIAETNSFSVYKL
ncbi:MAG: glycosyltransferase family 39 protein [Flavobacteriales bacterium]|nr:glycosyltransferase family 39 protein [Flavobacteriales bacterium]